jgi:hypothetical protein
LTAFVIGGRRAWHALQHRGDALVAFRPDGVVAWMVAGPPELFFDAAMGRPGRPPAVWRAEWN